MEPILEQVDAIINGERLDQYGRAEDNFEAIADCWTVVLRNYLQKGARLDSRIVALMMVAFKVIRESNCGKYDNWLDMTGYAALGGRIFTQQQFKKENSFKYRILRAWKKLLGYFTILALLCIPVVAYAEQPVTGTVFIRVEDQNGNFIPGTLMIYPLPPPPGSVAGDYMRISLTPSTGYLQTAVITIDDMGCTCLPSDYDKKKALERFHSWTKYKDTKQKP